MAPCLLADRPTEAQRCLYPRQPHGDSGCSLVFAGKKMPRRRRRSKDQPRNQPSARCYSCRSAAGKDDTREFQRGAACGDHAMAERSGAVFAMASWAFRAWRIRGANSSSCRSYRANIPLTVVASAFSGGDSYGLRMRKSAVQGPTASWETSGYEPGELAVLGLMMAVWSG